MVENQILSFWMHRVVKAFNYIEHEVRALLAVALAALRRC